MSLPTYPLSWARLRALLWPAPITVTLPCLPASPLAELPEGAQ